MSAARSKDAYLASQYARPAGRRGKPRARKAIKHSILVAAFHMLASGVPNVDLGGGYYLKRKNRTRRAAQRPEGLGLGHRRGR